ncbi:MAG: type II/IV secretion system protein [Planctomycetes bacterium]|nr:type II/IV secretion system protein [Planctomycetota bacterium]
MAGKINGQDVAGLLDDILARAVQCGASDIHFEPGAAEIVVKYRQDGSLQNIETLPGSVRDNVISRLKVLGNLLTYRNDIPQEGRIELGGKGACEQVSDMRLAVFPTIFGQRAVIRIFYQNSQLMELEQLGFSPAIFSALKDFAGQNQGLLLLTGPAGSGKSTTLAALLRHILKTSSGQKSIVALEDPVERIIEGVTQVQIPPQGAMDFPIALRSLLRQDPEVLMLGEIRDAETARIAVEAGLTGHLLMSTMHSGTCCGAMVRMLEMGIEPYQITSALCAVVNQRLVRKLCEHCKKSTGMDGIYQAVGCPKCLRTGYHGRLLTAEMVTMDGELRKAVLTRSDTETLEATLHRRGHMTLLQDGRRLLCNGLTSEDEIQRVCG